VKRRQFITLLGGAAAWPLAARAQQPAMPVIGFLTPGSPAGVQMDIIDTVRQGFREAGFIEGQNIAIDFRFAEGRFDRLPELAADLVRKQVNVIIALGIAASVAAKAATTTIPVVFYMGEDPVSLGLVPSLNRPSGNLTGVATLSSAVMAKRLELLHEFVPRAGVFAALINPKNPYAAISTKEAQDAARALGKDIHIVHAGSDDELQSAFATLAQVKAEALVIAPDGLFILRAAQVAALSVRHAIPASHERRTFPDAGGLMSYGASQTDGMRLAGVFVGRILKGEKPAAMPVMQPTKFELVINLKTAKALGLEVPPMLLARADEVIE
jgi:putative tryptophan/tyrosine transport system substrate-binding protein